MENPQRDPAPPSSASLQHWVLDEIMDRMNTCVYITDVETDEILFMNRTMKDVFGLESPEGATCWRVLQEGMDRRCDFCPVKQLTAGIAPGGVYVWEERNGLTGRIYENYDSLMTWTDGRTVHFQQSIDVTEAHRLSRAASLDELTGILNRRAGKDALERLLRGGAAVGGNYTLCMYDIDALKHTNDIYGHQAGDELLLTVTGEVRRVLEPDDVFFRLGGDEFVILFSDAAQQEAADRLETVRRRLLEATPPASFCYGLLPLVFPLDSSPAKLLALVDQKLYDQKRLLHIRRAERLYESQGPSALSDAVFTYDKDHLYDALVRSTDDYLYVANMHTGTFRYPRAMVEEFELPGEIVPNAAAVWGERVHPQDKAAFLAANQIISDNRALSHCVEYRAKNRRGEWVWLRCRGHLIQDADGQPSLFAGFITNLGRRNKLDHLTNLPNKFEFESHLELLLSRCTLQHKTVFLCFGIDELKRINNLFDHAFGDEVLRLVAQRILSLLPPSADAYRLDGDEFAVLLRDGSRTDAMELYRAIQETFSGQQVCGGKRFYCTLSCGCVVAPEDGADCQELLKHAQFALDYAKSRGRNRLAFFNSEMTVRKERALELTELLRASVERGFEGFELYVQPVFSAGSEDLAGAEALCRWHCEKYGPVSPMEFIPLLEESGLIHPVGRWIFRQAAALCAQWQALRPDLLISVNLSALQLDDPDFLPFMADTIRSGGFKPGLLIVELTESSLSSDLATATQSLSQIRAMGCPISLDDFGTGYSSLMLLKEHPIEVVKVDRAFVQGVRSSTFDRAFIRFTCELCRSLGMQVCLEGVETVEELNSVRDLKLDYLQGFYFSRPIPRDEFERRFLSGPRLPGRG